MRTDVSKKFAIDFRASLDKANGERPRDGSGRFGVDREGRGKAREEAKMGTGEARDQIRDLKNQGKSEEAHALDDHLRRMSNRLGEARARMLPDTMHLHGIRPPVPAKRTMFERPEIIVPKEDPISKEGTSEGAKLGWETRRHGGAPEAEKPEAGKPTESPKEPEKPTISPEERVARKLMGDKDAKGRIIVPDKVAEEGAKLAEELHSADRDWDGLMRQRVHLEGTGKKRDLKAAREIRPEEQEALKRYRAAEEASNDFKTRTGHDVIAAWQARKGERWPHYRVESAAGTVHPQYVTESKAEKSLNKEGTSEGAKLGWETRRDGGSPEAEKPGEKPKDPVTEPEKPGRPEYYDRGAKAEASMKQLYRAKEATAQEVHDVAAQMLDVGEKYLVDTKKAAVDVEQEFTSRGKEMRGTAKKLFEAAKGDLRRGDSLLEEGKKQLDDLKKMDPAKKIDVYDHAGSTDLPWRAAGQASIYLAAVRSYAPKPKVKKNASEEDEDAETEGEPSRRRPLPAEARAVMPVGTKKPPRPPGPPQPKQMRVGPRKIEGPRLMPITTPRNPTYVGLDR